MDLPPSFDSLIATMREADVSASTAALNSTSDVLGDKTHIRKTLVRHIVKRIASDFPGRRFSDLAILELGAGAGFFAQCYAEAFPHLPLKNIFQTDTHPQDEAGVITQLDVAQLSQADNVLSQRAFDVVLSVDFLNCLAFGRGLDPDDEDDVDEMHHLHQALSRILSSGGKYYDFMACALDPKFVMRFVPDYAQSDECRARPRFILVCDPGYSGSQGKTAQAAPLLFVTFDARLVQHVGADAAGAPLLQVAGHERPFTYEELVQSLGLLERHKHLDGAGAFSKKVLEFLFRDINDGGCHSNWELMSYIHLVPRHFDEVFYDDSEALVPVFMDTFATTVQFLRDSFKGKAESYLEIPLIDAYRHATAANLASLSVQHIEEDVPGAKGDCYQQIYHYVLQERTKGANGEGAFRCLLTTATARTTGGVGAAGSSNDVMIE